MNNSGQLRGEEGRFQLGGELTFATVNGILAQSAQRLFRERGASLEFDLGGVTRADSAGLALLIQWMRMARDADCTIRFLNLPEQLQAIAESSDLENILPIVR